MVVGTLHNGHLADHPTQQRTMPSLKLELLNPAFKGQQVKIKDGLTIGSGPEATLRAQHPSLLPLHAMFRTEEGVTSVEVIQDEAHIHVNGQDVLRSELRHGDLISVGPIRLRVLDELLVSRANMRLDQLLADNAETSKDEVFDFAKEDLFYKTTKEPALRKRISFVIPSKDKFLDQAQVFLSRLVKNSGADEEQIDAYMTVAKELILNAHRHGHKYDETKQIILRHLDDEQVLSLTVEDQGSGFDHRTVLASVNSKEAAQAARDRYLAGGFGGLGFQLITRLTKTLIYNDVGNVVTFTVVKRT